jgi:purine nucleosidase
MTLYHIDTDMGVDDGLALVVAAQVTGFSLLAVSTVFGNVPVEVATRNAVLFRHLLRLKTPYEVIQGADKASDGFFRDAREIHGDDGLGGATARLEGQVLDAIKRDEPGQLESLGSVSASNRPITLIGLGPATNIPRLVDWYGFDNITRIVLMAGVFFDLGNITPLAEFNAYCDPGALRTTLALGIPITLVPLDVCRKVQLSRTTVRSYLRPNSSPLMQLVVDSHMKYMDFYRDSEGIDGCFPHDTLAVFAASNPEVFFRLRGTVDVNLSIEARGQTSLTIDGSSHIDVVTGGDLKFVRDSLHEVGECTH